jgi:hypothetical protein
MMTTTTKIDRIDPASWCVVGTLSHRGVTYGRNETLPDLTLAEAERYEAAGTLVRLNADGTIATDERPYHPQSAEEYLSAPDLEVLQHCAMFRPPVRMLKAMAARCETDMRSKVLQAALLLVVDYAEAARARPARQR